MTDWNVPPEATGTHFLGVSNSMMQGLTMAAIIPPNPSQPTINASVRELLRARD